MNICSKKEDGFKGYKKIYEESYWDKEITVCRFRIDQVESEDLFQI